MNKALLSVRPARLKCISVKSLLIGFVGTLCSGTAAHGALIYVSNGLNKSITAYTSTGGISQTILLSGAAPNPEGLAFDRNGNLFIAEDGTHSVLRLAANGTTSTFASGFSADGMAFDQQGNLFVSDATTGVIYKITPSGSVSTFASELALQNPHESFGLAFDANGNLYDAAPGVNKIFKITPSGGVSVFAMTNSPEGLAFDRNGNLYASSFSNGTITKITPSGSQSVFAAGLIDPIGIAFDSEGNLYVAEHSQYGSIAKISPNGSVTTFIAATGGLPNCIAIPVPEPSSLILTTLMLMVLWASGRSARRRPCVD